MADKTSSGKPIIYYFYDDATGQISLSAYKTDDPEYESNHILIYGAKFNGDIYKHSSVTNVLSNVLALAEIYLSLDV